MDVYLQSAPAGHYRNSIFLGINSTLTLLFRPCTMSVVNKVCDYFK